MKTLRERLDDLAIKRKFNDGAVADCKLNTLKHLMEDMDLHPPSHYEQVLPDKGSEMAMALPHPERPNINVSKELKPATDLSEWLTKHNGLYYYVKRAEDYRTRYPNAKAVPYYLSFGDKYLKAFMKAKPNFTEKGQIWIDDTARLLRGYLEAKLKEDPYIESDEARFMDFVYSTHSKAYTGAGICHLSLPDLAHIIFTIDKMEFLKEATIEQIAKVLMNCIDFETAKKLKSYLESLE